MNSSGLYTAGATAGTVPRHREIGLRCRYGEDHSDPSRAGTHTHPPDTDTNANSYSYTERRGGVPFGPFHLPNDQYGVRSWYNGALRTLSPASASSDLAYAKAKGIRVVVSLPGNRSNFTNSDKTFNLSRWKQRMDLWRPQAALLATYYANGTILANYLQDEPDCSSCWGGKPITGAEVAEMGRYAKSILPGIPTVVRVVPAWFRKVGLDGTQHRPRVGPVWGTAARAEPADDAGAVPRSERGRCQGARHGTRLSG